MSVTIISWKKATSFFYSVIMLQTIYCSCVRSTSMMFSNIASIDSSVDYGTKPVSHYNTQWECVRYSVCVCVCVCVCVWYTSDVCQRGVVSSIEWDIEWEEFSCGYDWEWPSGTVTVLIKLYKMKKAWQTCQFSALTENWGIMGGAGPLLVGWKVVTILGAPTKSRNFTI